MMVPTMLISRRAVEPTNYMVISFVQLQNIADRSRSVSQASQPIVSQHRSPTPAHDQFIAGILKTTHQQISPEEAPDCYAFVNYIGSI